MEARDNVVVCRICGGAWRDAEAGDRCPQGDGGALVTEEAHFRWPDAELLGHVLAGKYPLLDVLGVGGMGAVYRAIQEPVGRPVALKVIRPERDNDLNLTARFKREAQVVAGLTDPAVVTMYDYGDSDGVLYMVLELIEGQQVAEMMDTEVIGPLRAVDIAIQVCGALAEAHSAGLVHRDLNPCNIMLHRNRLGEEKVKVLDFGIAKFVAEGPEDIRTREGIVLGTPPYMSPEQARDGELDGRSDIYAMGIFLYELVTGAPPFRHPTSMQTLMAHLTEPPPPIARGAAPKPLRDIIARALAKKPEQRFQTAEALAEALMEVKRSGVLDQSALTDIGTIRSLMPPDDHEHGVTEVTEPARLPDAQLRGASQRTTSPTRTNRATIFAVGILAVVAALAAAIFMFTDPG